MTKFKWSVNKNSEQFDDKRYRVNVSKESKHL